MSDNDESLNRRGERRARGLFERPPGSGIWWVRYMDENGRLHREKVGPKSLALKVYQKRKNEIQERRFFPERIRRRDVLLSEMIDDYLERAKGALRSYRDSERHGERWKKVFRGKTLAQILPGDVERYMAKRINEVEPASVNRELAFLKHLFNVAIADGKADTNPVRSVKLFHENNQRVRFLTDDEEAALRRAIGGDEWPKVAFAFLTGFRQSNQFRLRWADVKFDTGTVCARKPKGGKDYHVPMNDELRAILGALPSRLRSEWVFPSETGETPIDARNYVRRTFLPALKAAKIEDLRWHDLRHTFASRLVMAGVDIRTVQELMGHKTITMTLRYAHLSPAHQLEAVQRLNRKPTDTTTDTEPTEKKTAVAAGAEVRDFPRERSGPPETRTRDPLIKSQLL